MIKLLFWSLLVWSLILSVELFLDIIAWYYCLILFLHIIPWYYSLILLLDFIPWYYSLILFLDIIPWCYSLILFLVLDIIPCPWYYSLMLFLDIIPWYYSLSLILFLKLRLIVFLRQSLISSHFSESILKQYYCYHLISSSLIKHQFIIHTDWIGTHTWRYQDRWNHALRTTIRVVHLTCSTGSRGISQE